MSMQSVIGVESEGSFAAFIARVWALRDQIALLVSAPSSAGKQFDDGGEVVSEIFSLILGESEWWRSQSCSLLLDAFRSSSAAVAAAEKVAPPRPMLSLADMLSILEHLSEYLGPDQKRDRNSTNSGRPDGVISCIDLLRGANVSRADMRGMMSLLSEANIPAMTSMLRTLYPSSARDPSLCVEQEEKMAVAAASPSCPFGTNCARPAAPSKRPREPSDDDGDDDELKKGPCPIAEQARDNAVPFLGPRPPEDFRWLTDRRGLDDAPAAPLDPEHPQRVMDCTCAKLCRRMLKFSPSSPLDMPTSSSSSNNFFFADTKYDGERLIGYKRGSSLEFFSRNMKPVPIRKLDGVPESLTLAFGPKADYVFDAEILSKHTFGSLNEVKKNEIHENGCPIIYVFDLIWYNGHSLATKPLAERRAALKHVMKIVPKKVVLPASACIFPCPLQNAKEPSLASNGRSHLPAEDALQQLYNSHMSRNLEGLVLKPAWAPYTFGGTHWVKLKRNYIDTTASVTGDGGGGAFVAGAPRKAAFVDVSAAAPAGQHPNLLHKNRPLRIAESRLNDTLDVGLIGWSEPAQTLLCTVYNKGKAQYVTCGFVPLPPPTFPGYAQIRFMISNTFVPLVKSKRRASNLIALSDSAALSIDRIHPSYALEKWRSSASVISSIVVAEIAASTLVESVEQTCDGISLGQDATIVRLREDKDATCLTSAEEVVSLFAEGSAGASSCYAEDCVAAVDAAVRRFNDMHWDALSPPDSGMEKGKEDDLPAISIDHAHSATAAAAAAASSTGNSTSLHVVIVPVAPQKAWLSTKGTMGEVSTVLGGSAAALSNAILGARTAAFGDVCATRVEVVGATSSSSGISPIVVPVAVVKFEKAASPAPGSPTAVRASLDASVLGVVAIRVASLVQQLARSTGPSSSSPLPRGVPGAPTRKLLFSAVVLHIDCHVFRRDIELWKAAFADLLRPSILPGCSLVLHAASTR